MAPEEGAMHRMVFAAAALAMVLPAAAVADKPGKARGKGKGHAVEHGDDVQVTVHFDTRQREIVRDYFVRTHGRDNCPPGLAKKNNGCLPPGQAKKAYAIGRAVPPSVIVHELPPDLSVRLGPAPRGYRYAVVDGDLVKLALGTALVVDAIEGLVH